MGDPPRAVEEKGRTVSPGEETTSWKVDRLWSLRPLEAGWARKGRSSTLLPSAQALAPL